MEDHRSQNAVNSYVLEGAELGDSSRDFEEWEGEDNFGNPGVVAVEKIVGTALTPASVEEVTEQYRERSFAELPRDSLKEDDLARLRYSLLDPSDPFLWESDVEVGVGGRELSAMQRTALTKKLTMLRAQAEKANGNDAEREDAERMIEELEAGLMTRITVEVNRRTFRVEPLVHADDTLGQIVPVSRMSQLVYTVTPLDGEDSSDPMYLTVLGAAPGQVTFLFTGGIAGQRLVTGLDNGVAHHAWFQNRQNSLTDDTAPWVSCRIYGELASRGESEIVIRWEREEKPIAIRKTGEDVVELTKYGETARVPVLVAETEKEDRLWIVADPVSPLVLRMEEKGADLLRQVEEVRQLEGY
jgi:hypothetical protein